MRLLAPRLFAASVLAALVSSSVPARADDVADAKDLFVRGRDLREKGNCAAAVDLFRKAADLYPSGLGSIRNLAECEEQLGHFASSRRAWLDLRRGLLTTDDHKYDGWSRDAEVAAARLVPKIATLTVDLNVVDRDGGAAPPKGLQLTLDGAPLAMALVGTALERDPGRHVVRVEGARVVEPQERAVALAAGDNKRLALRVTVVVDPPDATQAPEAPAPAQEADGGLDGRKLAGWITLGAGAASLIGAAVSLAVRQSALNDVSSTCPSDTNCPTSLESTVSRGQTASTLFTVFGLVGIAGVGGGLGLILTAPSAPARVGLVVAPTPGGAMARWSF
jgi:hypothetical protein